MNYNQELKLKHLIEDLKEKSNELTDFIFENILDKNIDIKYNFNESIDNYIILNNIIQDLELKK